VVSSIGSSNVISIVVFATTSVFPSTGERVLTTGAVRSSTVKLQLSIAAKDISAEFITSVLTDAV